MVEAAGIEPALAYYPCGCPTHRDQNTTVRSRQNPSGLDSRAGNRTPVGKIAAGQGKTIRPGALLKPLKA